MLIWDLGSLERKASRLQGKEASRERSAGDEFFLAASECQQQLRLRRDSCLLLHPTKLVFTVGKYLGRALALRGCGNIETVR
jgi:hypothetical protein